MAAAGALGPSQAAPLHRQHGRKRSADTSLETEQRLSKRLDLLHLENNNNGRYYVAVPGSTDSPATAAQSPELQRPHAVVAAKEIAAPSSLIPKNEEKTKTKKSHRRQPEDDGYMAVEDTPHRVFIRDLSAELSDTDVESDEDRPIFLADIEKHIAKIPKHVLQASASPELKPTRDNQLVLYSVPSSLTLPEEHDRVRKAILEARARMRERQASPVTEPVSVPHQGRTTSGMHEDVEEDMAIDDDPDAMDIDG